MKKNVITVKRTQQKLKKLNKTAGDTSDWNQWNKTQSVDLQEVWMADEDAVSTGNTSK